MNCQPCGKSFTGLIPYAQHMKSEKHKRKVSSLNILGSPPSQVECADCHISFDSAHSYINHECKEQNDTHVTSDMTTSNSMSSDATSVDTTGKNEGSVPNNESPKCSECKTCNKKFSGSVPYVMHLESAGHKRNVVLLKSLNNKKDFNSGTELAESDSNKFFCDPCKKMCTGPEPYKQHLASSGHKKKTGVGNDSRCEETEKFSCETCKKKFTGKIPYEFHIASNAHKKKLKLIGETRQDNEIGSDSECDSPPNNKDANKPWFCKFCHIQCSGQIPYKQHLEGDLHSKNARIAPKRKRASIAKSEDVSMNFLDASREKKSVTPKALSPLKDQLNESIDIDLSHVTKSLKPPDDLSSGECFSGKESDADVSGEKSKESTKENGSHDAAEELSDEKEMKSKDECKLCSIKLSKEDASSHYKSAEHVLKEKSVKRLQPPRNDDKAAKKLRLT